MGNQTRFNAKEVTTMELEQTDRNIREKNYNYEVDLSTLYQLRSLINEEVRNEEDKRAAFYRKMEKHDNSVFQRPGDDYFINRGGSSMSTYLHTLRKIKELGGTEFDKYWEDNQE